MSREEEVAIIISTWQRQHDEGYDVPPACVIGAHPDLARSLCEQFAVLEAVKREVRPRRVVIDMTGRAAEPGPLARTWRRFFGRRG